MLTNHQIYDVFISYRRNDGAAVARSIRAELSQRGFHVFMDVASIKGGYFDETLLQSIAKAPNFVVILTSGALDRCNANDDWLRREIAQALNTGANIVPIIFPDFKFPFDLPENIRSLTRHQAVKYDHEYFDAMVDKIAAAIQQRRSDGERKSSSGAPTENGAPSSKSSQSTIGVYSRSHAENSPRLSSSAGDFRKTFLKIGVLLFLAVLIAIILSKYLSDTSEKTRAVPDQSSSVAKQAAEPLRVGIRNYNLPSRHIVTYVMAGGNGVDVQLLRANVQPNSFELVFHVRAGENRDLLMYEPPGGQKRKRSVFGQATAVDSDFEELFIVDDIGGVYKSTTGLVGGTQISFNNYNFIRRINFAPGEGVDLSIRFPAINKLASSVTFISPNLNGWQSEWRWPAIALR